MTRIFTLENLGCANCAAKLERSLNKMKEVDSATVTFMTKRLVIEAQEEKMDAVVQEAGRIIKKLEPKVEVKPR